MIKFVSSLLLLLSITSCGQGSGESKTDSIQKPKAVKLSASEAASKISFKCEDDKCPTSFGIVVKNNANSVINNSTVCSGFFISKKDFITSRECMGEYIYKCSNDVAVKDINGNAAVCKNITHGFVNTKNEEDLFVHIELSQELDVVPVTLSSNNFSKVEYYSRWNVEKTYQNDEYILAQTKNCRLTVNNVRFPVQQNGAQRDVVLTNCPPSPEAIGSALLDSNHKVVGLVTRAIDEDSRFDHLMGSRKGRKLIYATPTTCLAFQRPELFKGIELDELQKLLCVRSVDETLSYYYDYLLTKIFVADSHLNVSKVILDNSDENALRFVKISHPECIKDVMDVEMFRACEFSPTITSDYEVYRPRITRCKDVDSFEITASLYTSNFFEVNLLNKYSFQNTQIYIEACH